MSPGSGRDVDRGTRSESTRTRSARRVQTSRSTILRYYLHELLGGVFGVQPILYDRLHANEVQSILSRENGSYTAPCPRRPYENVSPPIDCPRNCLSETVPEYHVAPALVRPKNSSCDVFVSFLCFSATVLSSLFVHRDRGAQLNERFPPEYLKEAVSLRLFAPRTVSFVWFSFFFLFSLFSAIGCRSVPTRTDARESFLRETEGRRFWRIPDSGLERLEYGEPRFFLRELV